ncbi:MAG: DUF4258 domain-containing protein [SAR324 cluster bacterium]|nr:DUF4258 domain-containing protein [SAR324 cluster bacterium]
MLGKLTQYLQFQLHEYQIEYRVHSTQRMAQRNVTVEDVESSLLNGDVIEEYLSDFPFPSVLMNAVTPKGRRLHVVVGMNHIAKILVIITVYEPDPVKWDISFTKRIL